jgi:hypothetical protein
MSRASKVRESVNDTSLVYSSSDANATVNFIFHCPVSVCRWCGKTESPHDSLMKYVIPLLSGFLLLSLFAPVAMERYAVSKVHEPVLQRMSNPLINLSVIR